MGGNIKIGTDIDSYDKWLQDFIVPGIVFIASCTSVVVVCVKTIQKKRRKVPKRKYDMHFLKIPNGQIIDDMFY